MTSLRIITRDRFEKNALISRWPALIVFSLCTMASADPATIDTGNKDAKPYTLFMGADFQVEHNQQYFQVEDVIGGSFIVEISGKKTDISMTKTGVKLQVSEQLKLSTSSATISNLKAERAYTPANDPLKKFLREDPGSSLVGIADNAKLNAVRLNTIADETAKNPNASQADKDIARSAANRGAMQSNDAVMDSSSFTNSTGAYAGKMQGELSKELFDAVRVTFRVSSEKPLYKPYIVLVARYREEDEKPGIVHNWIYAKELDPIDSHIRSEQFLQGGFPPGFTLLKTEFHLYNFGRELATDVSAKRVSLARDEAFEYTVIDYVGTHKGASLPPTPAMLNFPDGFYERLSPDQVRATYFVKVNKEGLASAAYTDEACKLKVDDPLLDAGIKTIWFKPALEKGKPVDGVAKLKLNHLTL